VPTLNPIRWLAWLLNAERVILLDPDERVIRILPVTREGRTFYLPGKKALLAADGTTQVYHRERWFGLLDSRYVLARERDAALMYVQGLSVDGETMDPGLFHAALKSEIATRFLRGGLDWKVLVIVGLIAALILAVLV